MIRISLLTLFYKLMRSLDIQTNADLDKHVQLCAQHHDFHSNLCHPRNIWFSDIIWKAKAIWKLTGIAIKTKHLSTTLWERRKQRHLLD